jgi:hypothetical protein
MSQTIDYFFNFSGQFGELAQLIRAEIGVELSPCFEGSLDLCGRLLGMDLFLGTNECENDQGIQFEDYRYNLDLTTYLPDGDLRPLQVAVMVAMPYLLYRRYGITGMLVFEQQHLIARYETRLTSDGQAVLFDSVSATFVDLPHHWRAVSSRFPGRAFTTEAEIAIIDYLQGIGRLGQNDT